MRKWKEDEEIGRGMRKWTENEEMDESQTIRRLQKEKNKLGFVDEEQ